MTRYDWPGNVRELQNVIERAVITSTGRSLRFDLPAISGAAPASTAAAVEAPAIATDAEMKRRERANLLAALEETGWKISGPEGAAELLGVRATTLSSRIKKLGLDRGRS